MSDFFEIDILDVESKKSGDAITMRFEIEGRRFIHVVDGGYQQTGDSVAKHIRTYYSNPSYIDRVIVTHPDGDHAGGVRTILEEFEVGELWMLRPWVYADELIDRFKRFENVENLKKRLREIYPNIAALEEIAEDNGVPIFEAFQGERIGPFTVMAPSKDRYLDLIVQSERTPESAEEAKADSVASFRALVERGISAAISLVKAAWGQEVFSSEETSAENEMSVVQFANLVGERVLLTGDAGRSALAEAADYALEIGLALPGIDRFQVPHHGSRRNVSTEVLDRWLGPVRRSAPAEGERSFSALISASRMDEDHPRKAVVRACIHRGGRVFVPSGKWLCTYRNAPHRDGMTPSTPLPYPEEQEE